MNRLAFMIGLAALPAVIILAWVRRMDRKRPEPLGLIARSVLYGFIAVIPAAAIESLLPNALPPLTGIGDILFQAFVIAALVEESVKCFFLRVYLFKRAEFDERVDGIVYAICVSMGFAFVENFLYGRNSVFILAIRAFTAVPGHAIFTGVMGYYLGRAKLDGGGSGLWIKGLAWAILLHGAYDAFLMAGDLWGLLVLPLLIGGAFVLGRLFKLAQAADTRSHGESYE